MVFPRQVLSPQVGSDFLTNGAAASRCDSSLSCLAPQWGLAHRKATVYPCGTEAGDLVFGWKAWEGFVEEVAFETDLEGPEVNDFDRWGWGQEGGCCRRGDGQG